MSCSITCGYRNETVIYIPLPPFPLRHSPLYIFLYTTDNLYRRLIVELLFYKSTLSF